MKAVTRRKIEMGIRVLKFSRAHLDGSPGSASALTRLEDRLARAEQLAEQQREGILDVRTATARKRDLRRAIKRSHLKHLGSVAKVAAQEVPELAQMFTLQPQSIRTWRSERRCAASQPKPRAGKSCW